MRRTKEEALQTKEKLLDAALDVFLDRGYSVATLQQIAERAGLTRGAVYWHFEGKEHIYKELYERVHRLDMDLFDTVADQDLPPFQKLRTLVHSIFRNIYTNKKYSDYLELTTFKIEYAKFEAINREKTGTYDYAVVTMGTLIEVAIKEEEISGGASPRQIAKTLLLFIIGVCRLKFTAPSLYGSLDETLLIVDDYLDSLK